MKKCNGCPVLVTSEEGDMNGNMCLPSYGDVLKWYNDTGKIWACHKNPEKACVGFLIRLKIKNIPKNVVLITEEMSIDEIYM